MRHLMKLLKGGKKRGKCEHVGINALYVLTPMHSNRELPSVARRTNTSQAMLNLPPGNVLRISMAQGQWSWVVPGRTAMGHRPWAMGHGPWTMGHAMGMALWPIACGPWPHRPWAMGHRQEATGHKPPSLRPPPAFKFLVGLLLVGSQECMVSGVSWSQGWGGLKSACLQAVVKVRVFKL